MRWWNIGFALGLVACAATDPPWSGSPSAIERKAMQPLEIDRLDGDYRGIMRLLHDGSPGCRTVAGIRQLTVRNGQARMVIDPNLNSVAEGVVRPDGSFRLVGLTFHRLEMEGRIDPPQARATFTNPRCQLEFEGSRAG